MTKWRQYSNNNKNPPFFMRDQNILLFVQVNETHSFYNFTCLVFVRCFFWQRQTVINSKDWCHFQWYRISIEMHTHTSTNKFLQWIYDFYVSIFFGHIAPSLLLSILSILLVSFFLFRCCLLGVLESTPIAQYKWNKHKNEFINIIINPDSCIS